MQKSQRRENSVVDKLFWRMCRKKTCDRRHENSEFEIFNIKFAGQNNKWRKYNKTFEKYFEIANTN